MKKLDGSKKCLWIKEDQEECRRCRSLISLWCRGESESLDKMSGGGSGASSGPGEIVWVKCGTLYWPGTVQDPDQLPQDVKESLLEEKKPPKLIVKFFNEDG